MSQDHDQWLHDLRELGEELHEAFVEERKAISALDHETLTYLAAHKRHLAERLTVARATMPEVEAPTLRMVFDALRVEAQANAMLASAATEAVRALLGYESTGSYDRAARRTTAAPLRILATY